MLVGGVLKGVGLQETTRITMDTVRSLILRNQENVDKYKGIPIEKYLDEITDFKR